MILPDSPLEPVRVSLAYRLGEITLFERDLKGLADRRHFTAVDVTTKLPGVPSDASGTDFYFYPCYPVANPPPVIVREGGWIYYTPYTFKNYFIDLRRFESFEQYLATFSSKSRSTLRRKVKRFAEANGGQVDWRVMTTPDDMDEFMRLALPLSARTYQERLMGAGLPQSAEFAERLRGEAAAGRAFGYLLFESQKPVAYVLCFSRDGIATYDFVGFEPAAHAMSPGTVLQYLLLEWMFADGRIAIFDFTEGEGAQKEFFAKDSCFCAKTYVFRASFSSALKIHAHSLLNDFSTALGRNLEKWHLKQRVKKLLRRVR